MHHKIIISEHTKIIVHRKRNKPIILILEMVAKKTRGRQNIEMKKIENEDDRMMTFSKRRSGIYKKASELVTLTGAEIGIVLFSLSGKPFTFGHPSLEAVANRFLGSSQEHPNDNTHPLVEAHRRVRINELNQQHNELLRQVDEEKAREKILKQNRKGRETQPPVSYTHLTLPTILLV